MSQFKAGDLCYTAAPYTGEHGAFVVLVRPFSGREWICGWEFYGSVRGWVVDGWVRAGSLRFGPQLAIAESCLRKVDPGSGEDEMLRLTGKPEGASTDTSKPVEVVA